MEKVSWWLMAFELAIELDAMAWCNKEFVEVMQCWLVIELDNDVGLREETGLGKVGSDLVPEIEAGTVGRIGISIEVAAKAEF